MADVYVQLGLLGRRVEEIDAKMAELSLERADTERQIKELATKIVGAPVAAAKPTAAVVPSQGQAQSPPAAQAGLPPRYVKLLFRLSKSPGADVAQLAAQIYGNSEKASRINVSSDFSRLKTDGYVEPVARGEFRLTEKGRAVIAGGGRQND